MKNTSPKLLVLSSAFPPMRAGEAQYASMLCEKLAAQGTNIQLVTSFQHNIPSLAEVPTDALMDSWSWRDLPRLLLHIKRSNPDSILLLFIGWTYGFHPMVTFLPWFTKLFFPRTRFVTLFYNRHGASIPANSFTTRVVRRIFSLFAGDDDSCFEFGTLLTKSDAVIVFARRHLQFLTQVFPPLQQKHQIIPPPPLLPMAQETSSREEGRRELKLKDSHFAFIFFGLLYEGKGLETLFRAVAKLKSSHPTLRLVIVGNALDPKAGTSQGYLETLRALVRSLKIEDQVLWVMEDSWDGEQTSRYLYSSDAAILPFDAGVALNNSSVAAVATHALPLISTKSTDTDPEFHHEENVLLATPCDFDRLAVLMATVMTDETLRKKLKRGSLDLARNHFSWELTLHGILDNCFPTQPSAQDTTIKNLAKSR